MKRWLLLCALTLAACSGKEETKLGNNDALTKPEAEAMGGQGSDGEDLCEQFGWYDDGTCDDFCVNEDPDCLLNNGLNFSNQNLSTNNTSTNNTSTNNATNNSTNNATNNSTNNMTGGADCGGIAGLTCAATEWCDYPNDSICGAADQLGSCLPRPDACTREYAPVCGCDGNTYGNECEAQRAGVDVAAAGECATACGDAMDCAQGESCVNGFCEAATACGGFAGQTCANGEFCDYALVDMCGAADQQGVCTAIPQACPDVFMPVCGCDNKTYGNSCEANASGVAVAADGACKTACDPNNPCPRGETCVGNVCEPLGNGTCGGIAGLVCADTQWCDYPDTSMCGAADQLGTCLPRPDACTLQFDPVCGCDGQDYSNACFAHVAGVDVAASGNCP